jgi:hypothetical protein
VASAKSRVRGVPGPRRPFEGKIRAVSSLCRQKAVSRRHGAAQDGQVDLPGRGLSPRPDFAVLRAPAAGRGRAFTER